MHRSGQALRLPLKEDKVTIGIVGLGLIGGSLARSIKCHTKHTVLGTDLNETALLEAKMVGAIDGELTDEKLPECGVVLVALYPGATVSYILSRIDSFGPGTRIVDCCGVKRWVCGRLFPAFEGRQCVYMGGHPMAGRERSGFSYSQDDLFESASMILTPAPGTDVEVIRELKEFFLSIGFARVRFSTPEEHDEMISFTSQMAHIVSSAYVNSPLSTRHRGFSAGSFRDMTRVARLNEDMWTELFLENGDLLTEQTDRLIDNLKAFRDAIADRDEKKLRALLSEGNRIKVSLED